MKDEEGDWRQRQQERESKREREEGRELAWTYSSRIIMWRRSANRQSYDVAVFSSSSSSTSCIKSAQVIKSCLFGTL